MSGEPQNRPPPPAQHPGRRLPRFTARCFHLWGHQRRWGVPGIRGGPRSPEVDPGHRGGRRRPRASIPLPGGRGFSLSRVPAPRVPVKSQGGPWVGGDPRVQGGTTPSSLGWGRRGGGGRAPTQVGRSPGVQGGGPGMTPAPGEGGTQGSGRPYPGRLAWGRTRRWSMAATRAPASRTPTRAPATTQARNGGVPAGPEAGAPVGSGVPSGVAEGEAGGDPVLGGPVMAGGRGSPAHGGPMAVGRRSPSRRTCRA